MNINEHIAYLCKEHNVSLYLKADHNGSIEWSAHTAEITLTQGGFDSKCRSGTGSTAEEAIAACLLCQPKETSHTYAPLATATD